jgi:hypothetical protein
LPRGQQFQRGFRRLRMAIDQCQERGLGDEREPGMAEVLVMTDKLKAELLTMLVEHQQIVAALAKLVDAAKEENKSDVVHFAEKLMLHAQTEEQVSYPTAILIGEFIKSQLGK